MKFHNLLTLGLQINSLSPFLKHSHAPNCLASWFLVMIYLVVKTLKILMRLLNRVQQNTLHDRWICQLYQHSSCKYVRIQSIPWILISLRLYLLCIYVERLFFDNLSYPKDLSRTMPSHRTRSLYHASFLWKN